MERKERKLMVREIGMKGWRAGSMGGLLLRDGDGNGVERKNGEGKGEGRGREEGEGR